VSGRVETLVSADDIEFGAFRLERRSGRLLRCDENGALTALTIGARSREILCVLVGRAGEIVSRQEIMDTVWGGVAVEENNLTVQLSALRRILDEGRAGGSCIETVPGRGYRLSLSGAQPTPMPRLPVLRPVRCNEALHLCSVAREGRGSPSPG
jgi:DNA-binding winged helix-turn-helix (wHTH) protein